MPCDEYSERSQGLIISILNGLDLDDEEGKPRHAQKGVYRLPCKDSCKRDAWLRRLDDAFGPVGNSLQAPYTDYLLQMGSTGGFAQFIYELEKTCFNLVQSCVDTGLRQQFNFKPMNSTRRRIIHELAEYYGLDSQAYDEEPNKHVVIFGYRNRVKIPDASLTSVIAKKAKEGARTIPGVLNMPRCPTTGKPIPPARAWGAPATAPESCWGGSRNIQQVPDSDGWTAVGGTPRSIMNICWKMWDLSNPPPPSLPLMPMAEIKFQNIPPINCPQHLMSRVTEPPSGFVSLGSVRSMRSQQPPSAAAVNDVMNTFNSNVGYGQSRFVFAESFED